MILALREKTFVFSTRRISLKTKLQNLNMKQKSPKEDMEKAKQMQFYLFFEI